MGNQKNARKRKKAADSDQGGDETMNERGARSTNIGQTSNSDNNDETSGSDNREHTLAENSLNAVQTAVDNLDNPGQSSVTDSINPAVLQLGDDGQDRTDDRPSSSLPPPSSQQGVFGCPLMYKNRPLPTISHEDDQPSNNKALELTAWAYQVACPFMRGKAWEYANNKKNILRPLQMRSKGSASRSRAQETYRGGRKSYADALIVYLFGEEVDQPCTKCTKGFGKFPKCIVLDQVSNECANCVYPGNHPCSFYIELDKADIDSTEPLRRKARTKLAKGKARRTVPSANFEQPILTPAEMTLDETATMIDFVHRLNRIPVEYLEDMGNYYLAVANLRKNKAAKDKALSTPATPSQILIEDEDD